MGIAYAAYYSRLNIKSFDDAINDSQLTPCLQKILDDLKKTSASPGNMIVNFTNDPWNSTRFNWTVKSGTIKEDQSITGQTLASYNLATCVTTTFDSDAWPNATDLSWARTMLHESIHAYLVTYFKIDGVGAQTSYPQLASDWSGKQKDLNMVHHEEMARSLLDPYK